MTLLELPRLLLVALARLVVRRALRLPTLQHVLDFGGNFFEHLLVRPNRGFGLLVERAGLGGVALSERGKPFLIGVLRAT